MAQFVFSSISAVMYGEVMKTEVLVTVQDSAQSASASLIVWGVIFANLRAGCSVWLLIGFHTQVLLCSRFALACERVYERRGGSTLFKTPPKKQSCLIQLQT